MAFSVIYGTPLCFVLDTQVSAPLSHECPPKGTQTTYLDRAAGTRAWCGRVHELSCLQEGGDPWTGYPMTIS